MTDQNVQYDNLILREEEKVVQIVDRINGDNNY
jgi:hypothetical protein